MSELDVMWPVPREVHGVRVLPVKMRQLPAFAKALTPIWGPLIAEDWWKIATEHYDEALAAILAATDGISAEELGEFYPDQFFELAKAVFEANLDFFGQRLLPMVREAVAQARQAGAASSQASSMPDSTSPASES